MYKTKILEGRHPFTGAIFFPRHKGIYLSVPKVASSTLVYLAFKILEITPPHPARKNMKRTLLPGIPYFLMPYFPDYLKFTFVRNPWDRIISSYVYLFLQNQKAGKNFPAFFKSDKDFNVSMNFRDFCEVVARKTDEELDGHIRSQSHFLKDAKGKLIPDYIGRIESFEQDLDYILHRLNWKNPEESIPRKNRTHRLPYQSYYDSYTQKLIAKRFEEDIEVFKYQF